MNSFYSPEELKSLGLKEYGENVLISRKCSIYGAENSLWASYDEIPSYLREAFISIEDKRFMSHKGVDWRRTAAILPAAGIWWSCALIA